VIKQRTVSVANLLPQTLSTLLQKLLLQPSPNLLTYPVITGSKAGKHKQNGYVKNRITVSFQGSYFLIF